MPRELKALSPSLHNPGELWQLVLVSSPAHPCPTTQRQRSQGAGRRKKWGEERTGLGRRGGEGNSLPHAPKTLRRGWQWWPAPQSAGK